MGRVRCIMERVGIMFIKRPDERPNELIEKKILVTTSRGRIVLNYE